MASSARLGMVTGITNARLATAKRGIAVEIASRLAATTNAPVCLIGADPTDRDVERHLPQLTETWGKPTQMQITRGHHHLEVAAFEQSRVCVVSVSDRESVELVLPTLQERFRFLIVDAPSRTGFGVGIANVLLDWLDSLVIATGLGAGELAETRRYAERLDARASARRVDVRVLPIGDPETSELAHGQIAWRLAPMPTIGHVPRLGGGVAKRATVKSEDLELAFRPIIRWILEGQKRRPNGHPGFEPDRPEQHVGPEEHVANRLYRESFDDEP
jgi:hypothetical protein